MPKLPPALLDDEHCNHGPAVESKPADTSSCVFQAGRQDPYGRDGPRHKDARGEWTVEPLAKYLKGVAAQIDLNLQKHGMPAAEKFDAFVSRLVAHAQRQTRHAPKKVRHTLQGLFS